jgi:RNA polymerase sigma-70 factor (ECF subfamily)
VATPSEYNEQTLLKKVAQGSETAFRELVFRYSDLLGTHIFRLTHSKEQAEEIVQDIFLKIWMSRETLSEVRNFRTYIYVISRNLALNAMRKIIRERNQQKEWQKNNQTMLLASADDTEGDHFGLLDKAIAELPPQQQRAWLLSRKEGLKHSEIAEEMELSKETVKKYIMLASQSITRYVEMHLDTLLLVILFFAKKDFWQ